VAKREFWDTCCIPRFAGTAPKLSLLPGKSEGLHLACVLQPREYTQPNKDCSFAEKSKPRAFRGGRQMRPDDERLRKQRKACLAARMHLKKGLSFLPGYPIRQEGERLLWQPIGLQDPRWRRPCWIGRQELREAQTAWTTLVRRFPRAIHHVIENVDTWKRVLPELLEILTGAIGHGRPLPAHVFQPKMGFPEFVAAKAERLARKVPSLLPLLGAISWVCCFTPEQAKPIISWLDRHRESVRYGLDNLAQLLKPYKREEEALLIWVKLAGLVPLLGPHRLETLVSLLGYPKALNVATCAGQNFLNRWREILAKAASSQVLIFEEHFRPLECIFLMELFLFLERFFREDRGSQRRALDLFNLLVPQDIFEQWDLWWKEVLRLLSPLGRIPEGERLKLQLSETTAVEYQRQLENLASQMPPEVSFVEGSLAKQELAVFGLRFWKSRYGLPYLQEVIFGLTAAERKSIFRLALQWISGLPASWRLEALRLFKRFLSYTRDRHDDSLEKKVVPLFRELLRRLPPEKLAILVQNREQLEEIFNEEIPDWKHTCEAIEEWVGRLEQSENLDVPIWVSRATDDPHWQQEILLELASGSLNLSKISGDVLQLASRMVDEPKQLVPTIEKLQELWEKDRYSGIWEDLPTVVQMFRSTPWLGFLREAILEEGIAIVEEVRWLACFARKMEITSVLPSYPEKVSMPEWAERYPEPLHPELGFLAALSSEAERTAEKILGKDFPPRERLRKELEALKGLVKAHPERSMLARRLENLQARVQQRQTTVSPARLEHLRAKLRRAIRREFLRQVQDNLRAAIGEALQRLLDLPQIPDWIWQPKHRNALMGILDCRHYRRREWAYRLGIQLLRRRCGPPPWRPWEAKPNQEFLAELQRRGIHPEPWVHPSGPVEAVGDNGRRVWLTLEQDPLEILQMGAYFNTCLSPWDDNFFAAIAVAADANKQVLYARDEQGNVVGRCLLGISKTFALLTYRPYCHDPNLNFPKIVKQFVEQLSDQMNIRLSSKGKVPCLTRRKWHPDVPVPLTETRSFLAKDSLFRSQLLTRPLGELRVLLKDFLGSDSLEESTLCQFLQLPEMETRAELVLLILPYIRRPTYVSTDTYRRIFNLLEKVKVEVHSPFHEEIRMFVREKCLPLMIKLHREVGGWVAYGLAEKVVRIDPWSVLRFIRATRPHGVRRDRDEWHSDRRELLAQAFAASGREDLARKFQDW